jgi:hypothetical protein
MAMWAVPRSASTAFEQMVAQRGDLAVMSEPFSAAYYDGPEALSQRFDCSDPEATFSSVRQLVLDRAAAEPVFVKDMACHVLPALDDTLINACTHTLLVRDPAWSLPSMARQWPDFTADEAGFEPLAEVAARLDESGADVVVVDTADLRRDPDALVEAWCEAVGLDFDPGALQWDEGMAAGWERWQQWHATTATSTGFLPPEAEPPTVDDPRLITAIERARPIYDELAARRLRP